MKWPFGGVDIIKDDELTADQPYCPLIDRVKEVMKAIKAADEEKGGNNTVHLQYYRSCCNSER